MREDLWLDLDSAIQEQLALQVALSLERHHAFMHAHGLSHCRSVVDLGTGSGDFLSMIASRHPSTRFYGIDNKKHMVNAAGAYTLANVEWIHADALGGQTSRLLESADGILMRYFVLHLPDTEPSLSKMLANTHAGARLWVLDLDTDYCRCDPPSEAFDAFVDLVQEYCKQNGVRIRTGAMLPPILDACGFDVQSIEVEPFNNRAIDRERFAAYLLREATLYHHLLHGTPGSYALRPLRALLEQQGHDASQFLQYGMVMLSAVKRPC